MKKGILIATVLVSQSVISTPTPIQPGVSPGASTGAIINSAGASTGENTRSAGSSTYAEAELSITHRVDTFKAPGASVGPRTTINNGTPIKIDNDLTEDVDPDPRPEINPGIRAKPDVGNDSPTGE